MRLQGQSRRVAQRGGFQFQRHQGLHQAKAGGQIEAHHAGRPHTSIIGGNLHILGFQDEIADREHQAVGADEHAAALTLGAQRGAGSGVLHGLGADADQARGFRPRGSVLAHQLQLGAAMAVAVVHVGHLSGHRHAGVMP